jgi:hypothetical protein
VVSGSVSHIDKYGIDVDDLGYCWLKELYALKISKSETVLQEDPLHIGYLKP